MDDKFKGVVESLDPKHRALLAMPPVTYATLPKKVPERGVYLFSEPDRHLYVGRTNRIRRRLAGHCRPSATHFTATFAFRLAREATGNLKASYTTKGSRADLLNTPAFAAAFSAAKARIAAMNVRFVEEPDPVRQALLEIYVATVLGTPYNDFDNH
ncbi:MAG: GIY-YIG nuclease family protein [Myxococcales bacterium]|nr:GIY-YIG nuclease family protein [Myxococcales bacterium]